MADYNDYQTILRTYNFTNLPDSDSTDDRDYPLQPSGSNNYSITYFAPTTAAILTSTGYYDSSSPEYVYFAPLNSVQESLINTFLNPTDNYSAFFSDVANITFQQSTIFEADIVLLQNNGDSPYTDQDSPLDLLFETVSGYSHDYFDPVRGTTSENRYGDIIFNSDNSDGWDSTEVGSAQYFTVLHELGHSLGLGHPQEGGPIDNHQYSIMADEYVPGMGGSPSTFTSPVNPTGLQIYDIAALQETYGRNYGGARGVGGVIEDTTYSAGNGFADSNTPFVYTIWDGAGVDVIDVSGFSQAAFIDLRQGNLSSIGAATSQQSDAVGNVGIAFHTVIENALGTNNTTDGDTIIGNDWENDLRGLAGDDLLYGDGFVADGNLGFSEIDVDDPNDPNRTRLTGADGDYLRPGIGSDLAFGGFGDDLFFAAGLIDGLEGDLYHGGGLNLAQSLDGFDTVDYSNIGFGLNFILNAGTGTAQRINASSTPSDNLVSIEGLIGTIHDDNFSINGVGGYTLDGNDGHDTLDYSDTSAAITADFNVSPLLGQPTVSDGSGNIDTLISIEEITGTSFDDRFDLGTGSNLNINGGSVTDTISFNVSTSTIDYTTGVMDLSELSQFGSVQFNDVEMIDGGTSSSIIRLDGTGNSFSFTGSGQIFDYSRVNGSIEANLTDGTVTNGGLTDTLGQAATNAAGGFHLFGSDGNDTITLNQIGYVRMLSGGLGDDTIELNDSAVLDYLYMGGERHIQLHNQPEQSDLSI